MDNNGNAVVVYEENANGHDFGIYANRWTAAGAVGARITVHDSYGVGEYVPAVALAPTGGQFVVAYNTDSGLQVTEMGSNNAVLGTQGPVTGANAAISIDSFGRYVVTYTRFNSSTNHDDIFSRRDLLN
jgi:hypothetical protein